jgi:outer membrane protein
VTRALHRRASVPLSAALALLASGCAGAFLEIDPMAHAPATPATFGTPSGAPQPPVEADPAASEVRQALDAAGTVPDGLGLPDLVDLALRVSPETRNTWASARAAAASAGAARGAYYPSITMSTDVEFATGIGTEGAQAYEETTWGPTWSVSWLLLDFGGRAGNVEAAFQALAAANRQHDQQVLDVVLDVSQAYYTLVGAESQVRADEESLADAEQSVRATEARMRAAVGTAADALQAQTTHSQVQLQLESDRGQLVIARGELNTAVGIPVETRIAVRQPAHTLDATAVGASVDRLLEVARVARPDLAAARAQVRADAAKVRVARSAMLPTLQGTGTVQDQFVRTPGPTPSGGLREQVSHGWPYDTTLAVAFPIFSGLQLLNQLRAARATLLASRAALASQEVTAAHEVWTSYATLDTAANRLRTSRALRRVAGEAFVAARVAYVNGLGDIVALLNSQIALASARAQEVQAETAWYLALAQLVHDAGIFQREALPDRVIDTLDAAHAEPAP